MAPSDESFLPQIVGLFYATFDPKLGPVVQHQVPENLITFTSASEESRSRSTSRSTAFRNGESSSRSPSPAAPTLLDFAPISDYVIPKKSLHGKLITLLTRGTDEDDPEEYRIMGFPCALTGEGGRYQRNEYIWNLCFVFQASSSLEAFEPVVRKCARILRSAELDSAFLSSPAAEHTTIPSVLEQLFEDLNSYSETSIPLDGFNSLELKLFPFFPNPQDVEDWHVPIALVDLKALKDDNWDITAARISHHINGVNHVRKIAELADADPALTRETLRHMLYYQVVMMVDIFQYSNMYTLKPSITRLAADETVMVECGNYVTRRGFRTPEWPELLRLYTKLQPGVTVHDWMEKHDILTTGIDPRRFVSFGIIKGFLRRVRRWPVLVDRNSPLLDRSDQPRRRVEFDTSTRVGSGGTLSTRLAAGESSVTRAGDSTFTLRTMSSNASLGVSPASAPGQSGSSVPGNRSPIMKPLHTSGAPTTSRSATSAIDTAPSNSSRRGLAAFKTSALRLRAGRVKTMEDELVRYLDGDHSADEIQVRFGMSWSQLEKLLGIEDIKGGMGSKGVCIIYR